MILRRVIKHFRHQEWTAIFLDFLIVVVGVFVGLQVQNWNEARLAAQAERSLLLEMHTALTRDAAVINRELARARDLDERISALLVHLQSGAPYQKSLDAEFGAVYGIGSIDLDRAAYESLKSQGINLITDPALRSNISQVYERTYVQIEITVRIEENVAFEVLRPYFLTNFRDLQFSKSATPLDYDVVQADPYFRNLAAYRRAALYKGPLLVFGKALEDINSLIHDIENKLGNSEPGEKNDQAQ
jgi:hypothetical protein